MKNRGTTSLLWNPVVGSFSETCVPPLAVQQAKEFLRADVPVLSELVLGCPQLCPDTSRVKEEMQKLKGSFQVLLICGRREASCVSLFFLLISSHLPLPKKVICM